jgi:hypothetical protein
MPPDLIDYAATSLLAAAHNPDPHYTGYLRDAVDRLLRQRDGYVETDDGKTFVREAVLREVLLEVTSEAERQFLAAFLPKLPPGEIREAAAHEVTRLSALTDALLTRLFGGPRLH